MKNEDSHIKLGVDLGGTKIEVIAINAEGTEIARKRIASPQGSYETTVRTIAALVAEISHQTGRLNGPVGVGTPGSRSPKTGLLRNANSTWLNGHPLDRDLEEAMGCPVQIANDANCFAVSEASDGAGAGASSVFGVILGTGVGGGLVQQGRLLVGANAIAGEWGHTPLPALSLEEFPGPDCWCGRKGCIETWLSGPAFASDYRRSLPKGALPSSLTAQEIATEAALGNQQAADALDRYIERLGRALSLIVNIFDPEVIVLGGGVSNIDQLAERTLAAMIPHVFSDSTRTRIVRNMHGDSSGVRGAARLWEYSCHD